MAQLLNFRVFHVFLCLCLSIVVHGESAQYCQFNDSPDPTNHIAFCMSTHMYHNRSTESYDMYLTMTINRPLNSSTGWTSIGLGETMTGSLMFIIYGDPLSNKDPIVSIRKSTGHAQPTLLSKSDLPESMDLRVVLSTWLYGDIASNKHTVSTSHSARVSLVCYSCHLWPETTISASSESQPWIWAWNPTQVFDEYAYDEHLKMHKHHASSGGWGQFYTNMKKTIIDAQFPPSLPPIIPDVVQVLSSPSPLSMSGSLTYLATSATSFAHGAIMSLAFLLLFPAGVIGIRSGSSKSYTIHWVLQLTASIAVLIGVALGLLKSAGGHINTTHQYVGIGLALLLGAQGLFGWWHHRRFLRLRCRTWVSHTHIWLGRVMIPVGWANTVSGLFLRGYGAKSAITIATVVVICVEAIVLIAWISWPLEKRDVAHRVDKIKPSWIYRDNTALDTAFTLVDETDEEHEDDDSGYGGNHEEDKMLSDLGVKSP